VSLAARELEKAGIATVVIGSARDIVEECAVPRFAFTDIPLGNPCGKPYDREMQALVVETALRLLESAFAAQTTVRVPVEWGDDEWRRTYMVAGEPG
jgi:hypothetical protein